MSYKIISSIRFGRYVKRLAKRYKSLAQDLITLRAELLANPQAGEPLGRDCFKVRMSIAAKNKGKSGGARVITCVKVVGETIYLLTIYDKSEQESISEQERHELLRENGLV